jgi:anion-transporting  ArsA/GET3 family ATPase
VTARGLGDDAGSTGDRPASGLTSTLVLDRTLDDARVVVLAGGGGVGKTTTAAGIGLGMARRGRRVCVLTIDPARRLADALGLEGVADEPVQVPLEQEGGGELWVVMLDAKSTWDGLIRQYADSPEAAEKVLQNRVYKEFSGAVAGTQEYTAVEKLHELLESGRWDVVLLDTPPTRNALDFLDAPQRLHSFLDSRALQLLLKPASGGLGLLGRGAGVFTGLLKRALGVDLLSDLIEFFGVLGGMSQGFSQRSRAVQALLAEPRTVFLLVAAPHPESLAEAAQFRAALTGRDIHYGGLVVNRLTRAALDEDEAAVGAALSEALADDDAADRAATMHEQIRRQAAHDEALVLKHLTGPGDEQVLLIPQLAEDVHDVAGLDRLVEHLYPAA